jgi:hypothetical protein
MASTFTKLGLMYEKRSKEKAFLVGAGSINLSRNEVRYPIVETTSFMYDYFVSPIQILSTISFSIK